MKNETINNNTTHNNNQVLDANAAFGFIDKGLAISRELTKETKEAMGEALSEREAASKARVERFTDEKGRELNRQYQEYLEGSVGDNFAVAVDLTKQKVALMEEISQARIKIAEEKAKADIELAKVKAKIRELKLNRIKMWVWRIAYPLLGIALGVLTHILLKGV